MIDITSQIIQGMENEFKNLSSWTQHDKDSSAVWTTKIKTAMTLIANNNKIELRCSDKSNNGKASNWEFLFDFVLLDTGKVLVGNGYFVGDNTIKKSVVIVESEISNPNNADEILYDFCKLLLGKAELKVMIYYHKNNKTANNTTINYEIQRILKEFSQRTDLEKYLICWFNHSKKNFSYELLNSHGQVVNSC